MTEPEEQPKTGDPSEGSVARPWRKSKTSSDEPAKKPPEVDEGIDRTLIHAVPLPAEPPPPREDDDVDVERTMISADVGSNTIRVPGDESGTFPTIPGLTIEREIGRGGMGVVYEATQGYLDRRVAVKLLSEQGCQSQEYTLRFQREARILAALHHPNVVSCFQAGSTPDGVCFLAMEFVDGPTLDQWIQEHGALTPDQSVRVGRAVASALAFAHRSGIIHRDVKAPNVLLKPLDDGSAEPAFPFEPKLSDLGLARVSEDIPTAVDISVQQLTVQGTVMGSPPTMAPEQFDAPDDVDFRTDIYGLGCVLFHCLTGRLAFPQATLTSLIARKTRGQPPDPRKLSRGVPVKLAELVRKMIATRPEDRPQSYEELLSDLEGPFDVPVGPGSKILVGAVATAGVLGAGWFIVRALDGGTSEPPRTETIATGPSEETAVMMGPIDSGTREELEPVPQITDPGGASETIEPTSDEEVSHDPSVGDPSGDDPHESTGGIETEDIVDEGGPNPDRLETETGTEDGSASEAPDDAGTIDEPTSSEDTTEESGDVDPSESPEDNGGAGIDDTSPPFEEPEPTLALPDLPALASAAPLPLMTWEGGSHALSDWTVLAGSGEAWIQPETGGEQSVQNSFEPGRFAAVRDLWAPSWVLTGELRIQHANRASTRNLMLVVALGEASGLALRQCSQGERGDLEATLAASWVQPRAEGGWQVGDDLAALSIGSLTAADYEGALPVGFRIGWNGEDLTIEWGLDGSAELRRSHVLSTADLLPHGAPRALGIELEAGGAKLDDFVVGGR